VDGVNIHANLDRWQRTIGYIPQRVFLCDDTIRRNVAFGLPDDEIDDDRIWHCLEQARLGDLVRGLEEGLDVIVAEDGVRFSAGQRQRIGIARALYHDPQVLVFDEATASLDNETEREITSALAALTGEKTQIIIAHRLSTVRHLDRLFYIEAGQVSAAGSYDELLSGNDSFRRMVQAGLLGGSPGDSALEPRTALA
jgi:ATP-binding cassette subfamily C protein